MGKSTKTVLVIALVVLIAGSASLAVFAITRPAVDDPGNIKLDVKLHTREQLVTAAYKIYGDNAQGMWVAKTIIKNTGKVPVYGFRITYKVSDYTDWTSAEVYPVIAPGETVRDYCWPSLDGEKVKSITTKTPVDLVMKYECKGKDATEDHEKIYLLGKNDFIFSSLDEEDRVTFADHFDNYRFLAAFITPNEELTKSAANQIAGGLATVLSDQDAYLCFLRCFDALRAYGVKYIMEPQGFWAGTAAQYVQFPHETIERKSGTCLDLAVAFNALTEAVGIKSYTALIPGHAIPLVRLPESGDLVPIESTFVDKDFAISHYPGVTSPEVTAEECIAIANDSLDEAYNSGQLILIDPEYWWEQGVMPAW